MKSFILILVLFCLFDSYAQTTNKKSGSKKQLPRKEQSIILDETVVINEINKKYISFENELEKISQKRTSSLPSRLKKLELKLSGYRVNKSKICQGDFKRLRKDMFENQKDIKKVKKRSAEYKTCMRTMNRKNLNILKRIFEIRKKYIDETYQKFIFKLNKEFEKNIKR